MTPAAPTRGGRAWRSTLGGRSVPRAAAAVQGASLRSLPLVRVAALAVLTDPLELLRAGPPSLEALGKSAGRVTGVPAGVRRGVAGTAPTPVRRSVSWAAAPVASGGAPAPRWRSAMTPASVTDEQQQDTEFPSAGRRLAGDRPGDPSVDVRTAPARTNPGPAPLRPDLIGAIPGRPARGDHAGAEPTGAAAVGSITAAALEAAARVGLGQAGATPPAATGAPATAPVQRLTDERPGSATTMPSVGTAASSATSMATSSQGRPRPEFGGGALDELLGRWQDSTQHPEATSRTASTPHSPFAPLSTALTTGFAAPNRSPDAPVDDVSLDQVEVALGELLRREVEQHGLEGGLV